ncbi:hypothetical protein ACFSBZ_05905 [Amnibacterium flavum]|uniref:SHOCT domain-containing protein n=1 Tax=Amnibacterium flavum TaxID=2173173 RepID=A0A2V1HUM1_9MICO|nr:hypothetical protein [Amnibacterium flavum]PVZ93997.1 hypothetical protein DDQ50_09575 [Amnibacterium flavum]
MLPNDNLGNVDFLFTAIPIVIAIVFVAIIVMVVRGVVRVRRSGHNPLTLQADLATKAMDSRLLAADRPLEARLSEVDRLHEQGTITDAEHEAARASILSGK